MHVEQSVVASVVFSVQVGQTIMVSVDFSVHVGHSVAMEVVAILDDSSAEEPVDLDDIVTEEVLISMNPELELSGGLKDTSDSVEPRGISEEVDDDSEELAPSNDSVEEELLMSELELEG